MSQVDDRYKFRADILHALIEKYKYQSYLEVGVGGGINYAGIDVPGTKHGVDPDPYVLSQTHIMTSDQYFDQCKDTFDLIFIDGLHRGYQAHLDVLAALSILNEDGTIVVHDCSPPDETYQTLPRSQVQWCGDVWRGWLKLRKRPDLYMEVVDTDYGVGIIRKGEQEPIEDCEGISYTDFDKDRTRLLNLVPTDHILKGLFDDPESH